MRIAAILAAFVAGLSVDPLQATTCVYFPPCAKIVWPGTILFSGKVVERVREAGRAFLNPSHVLHKYRVRVKEPFLGLDANAREVMLVSGSELTAGTVWLFDAHRQDGELHDTLCSQSSPLDSPYVQPLLRHLRAMKSGQRPGSLTVYVEEPGPSNGQGIRAAQVEIEGPERRQSTSQSDGRVKFDDLPPGKYRVTAAALGYEAVDEKAVIVDVLPSSCPVTGVSLKPSLQGRSRTGPNHRPYPASSDQQVRLRFTRVRHGQYWLMTASPHPRVSITDGSGVPIPVARLTNFDLNEQREKGHYSLIEPIAQAGPNGVIVLEGCTESHYRISAHPIGTSSLPNFTGVPPGGGCDRAG